MLGEWRMWNTASRSKIVEIPPPQGNLTLQLQKDVPYGTGINVRYIKEPNNFNSRYDRHISDVFHNVVKDFFVECDNQINPMLAEAVGKTKSHLMFFFY